VAGVALFAVPLLLALPVYRSLEGVFVDDPMPTAGDLAKLAAGSTEYTVTQRPAGVEYVMRDENGRIVCRGLVDVRQYESVCLECDVRTGEFPRGAC